MALGVVAYVDEELRRFLGNPDPLEQRGRTRALLVDGNPALGCPVRESGRVSAALCDSGQERPSGDGPLDGAVGSQAISGYSAQSL
jgi:hypothetical protein